MKIIQIITAINPTSFYNSIIYGLGDDGQLYQLEKEMTKAEKLLDRLPTGKHMWTPVPMVTETLPTSFTKIF